METDLNLSLSVVGLEGLLLGGSREGLSISSTIDALLVNVSSEESDALATTQPDASRLRLGLRAVRPLPLGDVAHAVSRSPTIPTLWIRCRTE